MHFLYIIYSKAIDRYYIGESPDVSMRLEQRNNHYFKKNFTKAAKDWQVLLRYECTDRNGALLLEKFLKKMKSRVFLEKVISNPEILTDILKKKLP
ncbi:GIY-YIG nuclease family protein [Aequorivita echinoideorum]|uniref:GIY-YIG nuclease family protein n=1 Tax=Aequorivita echinoideorum TaxID=1549647 RepID=A0ABS5S4X4_9FLAO|nr:GIY-YIG nuclease family protein [Aequorivita echinoideorum]MBT0607422.1 GIY-YIG nuclease family protein [Aequorivita echinoideorum]